MTRPHVGRPARPGDAELGGEGGVRRL